MIIKNLEALKLLNTEQKIYDYVVSHLRQQNAQSVEPSGDCVYRNPDGLSCAVGCLIPDSEYLEGFEDNNVRSLLRRDSKFRPSEVLKPFTVLLTNLQHVHDMNAPAYWEDRFRALAERRVLDYTPPIEAE
jgi:hypothetical protein